MIISKQVLRICLKFKESEIICLRTLSFLVTVSVLWTIMPGRLCSILPKCLCAQNVKYRISGHSEALFPNFSAQALPHNDGVTVWQCATEVTQVQCPAQALDSIFTAVGLGRQKSATPLATGEPERAEKSAASFPGARREAMGRVLLRPTHCRKRSLSVYFLLTRIIFSPGLLPCCDFMLPVALEDRFSSVTHRNYRLEKCTKSITPKHG